MLRFHRLGDNSVLELISSCPNFLLVERQLLLEFSSLLYKFPQVETTSCLQSQLSPPTFKRAWYHSLGSQKLLMGLRNMTNTKHKIYESEASWLSLFQAHPPPPPFSLDMPTQD